MERTSRIAARVKAMPRHRAFYLGLAAGVAGLGVALVVAPGYAVAAAANAMFATYLVLTLTGLPSLSAEYLLARPDDADIPVGAIFVITGVVVIVAMASLFVAVNHDIADHVGVLLGVVSVLLGWFTVHTMTALHYAHEYYRDDAAHGGDTVVGGLDFPGRERPDGMAFIYFSYVIGMTAQVADVAVSSTAMRRRVTLHGLFSFFFNTVIVAATVNVVVALAGG